MSDFSGAWKLHKADAEDAPTRPRRGDGETQSEKFVSMALALYRPGRSSEGTPFMVRRGGPAIAHDLRGRDSFRSHIAHLYYNRFGSVPSSSALADGMCVLEGHAMAADPEPVHLRAAQHGEGMIYVDLGDDSGRCVQVGPAGWDVLEHSPVLFRRTETVGPIEAPQRGGRLEELRELLNVSDATFPPMVGWLVAAFFPEISHPVLLICGEQGTGKSSASEMLVSLIDPGPVPLRPPPRDDEQLAITAAGSMVLAYDNLSSIQPWFSDALCRMTTGTGWLRKTNYSDHGISVLKYRRTILLNGIGLSDIRGDLGNRMILIELERIDALSRRADEEIWRKYRERRPRILGVLFDMVSAVLAHLPEVRLDKMSRLADFCRVLAALDDATGIGALPAYLSQTDRITEAVIDSDHLAVAIINYMAELRGPWSGTATDLLAQLPVPNPRPKSWPTTPQALGNRLTRLAPQLREQGIEVTQEKEAGGNRRRLWRIVPPAAMSATVDEIFPTGNAAADQ